MCDRVWVGKTFRYVTCQPDQLSLAILLWVGPMSSSLWAMECVADWDGGMSACCTVGPTVSSTDNGWLHNALRYHQLMPISCHFRDCKMLLILSLTHIISTIASYRPLRLLLKRDE